MICGIPALEVARVRVLGADQKKSDVTAFCVPLYYLFRAPVTWEVVS